MKKEQPGSGESTLARLYVVATPIGNIEDITHRALRVLQTVNVIAAEDTRRTRILLSHYNIPVPGHFISCRAHNESQSANGIIKLLRRGFDVAYVSDAGTPGISDPGTLLVARVREGGFDIVPIPGASALTTLVCVSGIKSRNFVFEGFLSPKKGRRKRRIDELFQTGMTFVLYESSWRLIPLMEDIKTGNPESKVFIGREITKKFEEFLYGNTGDVLAKLQKKGKLFGEFTIIVDMS